MSDVYRGLAARFADAIVDQDYEAAHALFAKGLAAAVSAYDLEDRIQGAIDEVSEIIGLESAAHPGAYSVTQAPATLEELRGPRPFDPPREIAADVTPETFRRWMRVRFTPGPGSPVEIDAWFDVWIVVVESASVPAVGYFEIVDAD